MFDCNKRSYLSIRKTLSRFFLIFLFLNSFDFPANAQADSTNLSSNTIFFGTGFSHFRFVDRKVSPLIYSTNLLSLDLGFKVHKPHSIFRISLTLDNGFTQPKQFPSREFAYQGVDNEGVKYQGICTKSDSYFFGDELNIEYLRKVGQLNKSGVRYYFGGQIKQNLFYSLSDVPVLFHNELSINPLLLCEYKFFDFLNGNTTLSVPLISVVTRLPYSNDPTDGEHSYLSSTFRMGSRMVTPSNFQRINLSQEFGKKFNDKWKFALRYHFQWYRYAHYSNLNSFRNSMVFRLIRIIKS